MDNNLAQAPAPVPPRPPRPNAPTQAVCALGTGASIPTRYRALALRAASGRASPRSAIKAKCQECVGYEEVVERVGTCRVFRCPLWSYRPHQEK